MPSEMIRIEDDTDLNSLRRMVRSTATEIGFTDYAITKLVTASSEIARNVIEYASEGQVKIQSETEDKTKIQLVFEDEGPGIENVDRALQDGYSGENSDGLGVGLPGAQRLSDRFEIESNPGQGTRVVLSVSAGSNR
jgi:serine/threonine-protein kinase RsbT